MSSTLRRLAKDHLSLRKSLPPNYLFEDADAGTSLPDDLTQLIICLAGADDTPYAQGLWRLHLSMPTDYPKNPPKATFKTRIFHPNVEENTGTICLETLKRDWDPKLTLKDILITISCLLIHPNPDSALNAKAGSLIQEDYEGFSRQAKLMTNIHAPIPKHLRALVCEAKRRGEDTTAASVALVEAHLVAPVNENVTVRDDLKENDRGPSQNSHVSGINCLGKRALPDKYDTLEDQSSQTCRTATQRTAADFGDEPRRKSPKHHHNESADRRDIPAAENTDKENMVGDAKVAPKGLGQAPTSSHDPSARTALRKISNGGPSMLRNKARIGIRRL